jgi:hypothetical protein
VRRAGRTLGERKPTGGVVARRLGRPGAERAGEFLRNHTPFAVAWHLQRAWRLPPGSDRRLTKDDDPPTPSPVFGKSSSHSVRVVRRSDPRGCAPTARRELPSRSSARRARSSHRMRSMNLGETRAESDLPPDGVQAPGGTPQTRGERGENPPLTSSVSQPREGRRTESGATERSAAPAIETRSQRSSLLEAVTMETTRRQRPR